MAETPPNRADALSNSVWADIGTGVSAFELIAAVRTLPAVPNDSDGRRMLALADGTDGSAPTTGAETTEGSYAAALATPVGAGRRVHRRRARAAARMKTGLRSRAR